MSILIISCSLNPASKSNLLAIQAQQRLEALQHPCSLIDLRTIPLPACDGDTSSDDPRVQGIVQAIENADGVLIAAPIYNYDVNAACKNLIELTGSAWEDKIVGFLCAAGGSSSYMSILGLAGSMMLDFRCLIIPRFVYAQFSSFTNGEISDPDVLSRVNQLTTEMVRLTKALSLE